MGYRVAVVGATGNVGREMLNILAEREFPVDEIVALASRKSLGTECSFGDRTLKTLDLDGFDFKGWDIALFAIGSDATQEVRADRREGRVRGDRQLVALPLRPRGAADRAGGEPGRDRGLRQEEHHRQPELLDRADGGGAEAAARPGAGEAGRGRDLPVGVGRAAGRRWTSSGPRPRACTCPGRRWRRASSRSRSPSTSSRRSTASWRTAPPARSGRWSAETKKIVDPSIKVVGDLRAGAGVRRPFRGDQRRVRGLPRRGGGARDPARGAGGAGRRQARGRRLRDADRVRRRLRHLSSAASARTRRSTTGCRCGWCRTTCARARRSTRCRSPSCSGGGC